jgi:hypothetical protein
MRAVAVAVVVLTLVAIIVDGMLNGLSFGMMLRWTGLAVLILLALAIGSVAVHALRGAGSAQRQGERLSSDDVGLRPRRRPPRD